MDKNCHKQPGQSDTKPLYNCTENRCAHAQKSSAEYKANWRKNCKMKFPSYERQNKWMLDYIKPIFELDFPKLMRNYRMNKSVPFTYKRMAQIRKDVLADARDKAWMDRGSSDYTCQRGSTVTFIRYDRSGRMAPLEVVIDNAPMPHAGFGSADLHNFLSAAMNSESSTFDRNTDHLGMSDLFGHDNRDE